MNTAHNNLADCAVFKRVQGHVKTYLFSVAVALCCNTALALDINQANEAELDSIKGMGPALSAKVLQARADGLFKNWPDLMQRVSGIRHHKARNLSEQGLTVNGQPFDPKP